MKVVILGEAKVGKTTLINRYISGQFTQTVKTIGAAFVLKRWNDFNIAIWDTAGEERFSGLSSFYCRNAGVAILAFDITQKKTFDELSTRFMRLLNAAPEDCYKVVVATKSDLISDSIPRCITVQEGQQFAQSINEQSSDLPETSVSAPSTAIPYFETSSKTGTNVVDLFEFIFSTSVPRMRQRKRTDTVEITEKTEPISRSKCSC